MGLLFIQKTPNKQKKQAKNQVFGRQIYIPGSIKPKSFLNHLGSCGYFRTNRQNRSIFAVGLVVRKTLGPLHKEPRMQGGSRLLKT